jgi:hypothetical protein
MRTACAGARDPSSVPAIDPRRSGRAGAQLGRAGLLRAPRANSKGQEGKGDRQDPHDDLRSELNSLQQCSAGTADWQFILGISRAGHDSGSVEIFRNATEAERRHRLMKLLVLVPMAELRAGVEACVSRTMPPNLPSGRLQSGLRPLAARRWAVMMAELAALTNSVRR